jgi:hypothetical protein
VGVNASNAHQVINANSTQIQSSFNQLEELVGTADQSVTTDVLG